MARLGFVKSGMSREQVGSLALVLRVCIPRDGVACRELRLKVVLFKHNFRKPTQAELMKSDYPAHCVMSKGWYMVLSSKFT